MLVSAEEEWEKKLSTTGIVSDTKKVVRSANNADAPSNDGTRATTGTASAQHSQAHVKPGSSSRPSGYVSTTSSSFGRSNRIVESAEQWRKRLWPSKAITSFVRIITRCSPPVATVGESLFSSQLNAVDDEDDNDKHSAGRRENAAQKQKRERAALSPMDVGLKAHWTAKELRKVPESFGQDINLHSSIFFLLAVEECRASCLKAPEFTETGASTDKKKGSSSYRRYRENERFRVGMNGWVDGEVTAVLAESELSSLPKACEDPRLGSVWVLAVAVRHPTSRSGGHSGGLEPIPFGCGDLLLMQSDEWSNPVIGIVQPWDPDYDLKYGVNFSINQSSYIEQQRQRKVALRGDAVDGADYVDYTMINIMVCVESIDSSDSAAADSGSKGNSSETRASKGRKGGGASGLHSSSPIGGWAEAGAIRTGVRFNMAVMGSTTTSIRECQALMSLRFLDSKLKQIVLSDNHCAHTASTSSTTAQHLEAGEQLVDDGEELNAVPDQAIAETADTDSVDYNNVQEVLDELTEEKQSLSAAAVAANSGFESDASNESSDSDIGEVDEEGGVDEDAAHAANSIEKPTSIPTPLWTALLSQYNHSQLRAIASVCPKNATLQDAGNDSSLTLLQGPPGTGKTRTILGLIAVLLAGGLGQQQQGGTKIVAGSSLRTSIKATNVATSVGSRSAGALGVSGRKLRVLICAPSNTAVDELVYRIVTQGILGADGKRRDVSIVRVGQSNREDCHVKQSTHDRHGSQRNQNSSSRSMQEVVERVTLENVCERRINDISRQPHAALARGSGSGSGGVVRSKALVHGSQLRFADIRKQVLEEVDIVCSTLSGAGSQPLLELVLRIPGFNFDAVIIDEAAQAIEPSALIPFKYNPASVVLVGDPCQLPATVFSTLAKKARLGKSLFQRLQQAGYPVLMLETQYRMHPAIVNYPSRRFYRGNLRTGANVRNTDSHHMPYHADPTGRFRPFLFHHCSEGIETRDGVSICNRDEAKYVIDLFEELVRKYPDHRRNVGIIAPYRAQRRYLFRLFEERFRSGAVQHRQDSGGGWITVNDLDTEIATVDGFQGREKDIVIFSCVRAPATVRALKKVNSSAAARENRQQAYGMNSAGATATAAVGNNSSGGVDAEEEDITEAIGEELNDEADLEDDIAGIGFLREWQRLNVAITRAKYALWIVGNATFLQRDKEWMELIKHARKRGCFINTNQDNVSAPAQTYRRSDASKSGRGGSGSQHSDKNRSRKRRKSAATIPVNNNNRSCYAPQYSSYAERKASKKSRKNERKRQRREEQRREQSKN